MNRLAAVLCLMVFIFPAIASANLLTNGDFENPTPGFGWYNWGDSGFDSWAGRDGSQGFALYGWITNGYGGFIQEVAVVSHGEGDVYTFRLDGMAESGFASSTEGVELVMEFCDGSTSLYAVTNNIYAALTSSAGTWNTYSLIWTNQNASVDVVKVLLVGGWFEMVGGSCAAMWDNASLEAMDMSVPWLSLSGSESLYAGASNAWTVSRNGPTNIALTVHLTNSNPFVATVCTSVLIEAGSTSAVFYVSGVDTGTAVISVSAEGYQDADKSAVVSEQRLAISGSSVYAGHSNQWTVTREGPTGAALDVGLTSSAPLVLSAPASVTIAGGATTANFFVNGWTNGTAVLTASGIDHEQASYTTAVQSVALVFSGSGTVYAGLSNLWTLVRQGPVAEELDVTLESSPAGIVSAPSPVSIPAGTNTVSFYASGSAAGSAIVTASAPEYPVGQKGISVLANQLSLTGPGVTRLGMTSVWTVARTGPTTAGLTVSLTVDDPEVVSVPSSVLIDAGSTSATFGAVGLVVWSASVTASADDFIAAVRMVEVSGNLLGNPWFEEDESFGSSWFSWGDCGVEEWAFESGSNGVALYGWMTNGFGGFGQDVAVVSDIAGDVYSFRIDGMAEVGFGSASAGVELLMEFWSGASLKYAVTNNVYAALTSSVGDWNTYMLVWTNVDTSVNMVRVLLAAEEYAPSAPYCASMWDNAGLEVLDAGISNLVVQGDPALYEGGSNLWTVTRTGSDASPLTVAISSTNAAVAGAPASAVIAAGTNVGTFYVTGVSSGSSVIKVSADGYRQVRTRVTVSPATLELSGPAQAYTGFSNLWTVTRRGPSAGAATVSLSSSSPGVASVPVSVEMAAGSASVDFLVGGVSSGKATITASAAGFLSAGRVVTVSVARLTLAGGTSVYQGLSNAWSVTRNGPLSSPATVILSNNAPSIAALPATVEISGGAGTVEFFVRGTASGTATVVASLAGYESATRSITVEPNVLVLSGLVSVNRWSSNLWSVTRTGALGQPLDVALTSDAPSVVTVASSVTIPSGSNAIAFYVCGAGFGTTTVRATATEYTAAGRTAVVTANLLRNPGFEEDAAWGDAWASWGSDSVEPWAAESGSNGVAFYGWVSNGYAGFYQSVSVPTDPNGSVFVLRLRGRSDPNFSITNGGELALLLEFWGDGGTTPLYAVTNSILAKFRKHKRDWRGYSMVVRNANPAVDQVRVVLLGNGFDPTGPLSAAMWDNASLVSHGLQENALLLIGDESDYEGSSNEWIVVRLGSVDSDLTVQLSSDSPSVASVAPSVVIAAGSVFAEFDVTMGGGAPLKMMRKSGGEATISASATGYAGTNMGVNAEANVLTLAGDASVFAPGTSQWAVTRSGPLGSSVSVSLGSSDASAAAVPASIEISAGEDSAAFAVSALDSGLATITAQASGFESGNRGIAVQGLASEIDPTLESEQPTLTWDGLGGFRYVVEQATRLDGAWTRKRDLLCNANGLLTWQAADFAQATNMYYRVLTVVTNSPGQPYGP